MPPRLGVAGVQGFFLAREAVSYGKIERGMTFCQCDSENSAQKVCEPLQDKRFRQFRQNAHKRHIFTPLWMRVFARQGRRNIDRKERLEKNKRFFRLPLLIFGRGLNACSTPLLIYPKVEPQSFGCHPRVLRLPRSQVVLLLSARGVYVRQILPR